MIPSIGILGKFGYSALYLPSITFTYLYLRVEESMLTVIPLRIPVFDSSIKALSLFVPRSELPIYALIALIGGIWLHQFGIIVHGHDGPAHQPKHNAVVRTVMFGLAFNVPIDELPQTNSYRILISEGIPLLNRGTVRTLLVFLPAGLFQPLLIVSTLMIISGISASSIELTGGVLLLAQGALLVKSRLNNFFPSYVPEQAVDRFHKPEYEISEDRYRSIHSDNK